MRARSHSGDSPWPGFEPGLSRLQAQHFKWLSYPAIPWHWSGYLWGTCIPLTLSCSTIPDTGQGTCGVPADPWHWAVPLSPDTGQGTCGVPAYPWHWAVSQSPDTGQGTCGVPAYPWHWAVPLSPDTGKGAWGTCMSLTLSLPYDAAACNLRFYSRSELTGDFLWNEESSFGGDNLPPKLMCSKDSLIIDFS